VVGLSTVVSRSRRSAGTATPPILAARWRGQQTAGGLGRAPREREDGRDGEGQGLVGDLTVRQGLLQFGHASIGAC